MVEIPERILANWREWFGDRAEHLAEDIPRRARAAIEAWGLEDARPLEGGEVALVLGATREGRPVVCKVNPPDPALGREAAGLAHWSDLCPELLDTRDADDTLLMERLEPGTPLAGNVGSVDEELRVIGGLVRRLHASGPDGVERLADSELAREWMEALREESDRVELSGLLSAPAEAVIHTDLHAENVLAHGRGWRVIDPKPFRAPREAEVWALADATGIEADRAAEDMRRRLELYCEAAELDLEEARRWTRLRALAEASMEGDQPEWRRELILVAEALAA
jgi:streptomycin 6-kinase